jgi:hypothetical protein
MLGLTSQPQPIIDRLGERHAVLFAWVGAAAKRSPPSYPNRR